ncbi:hypothetical protein [Streptomyces sp. NPDC056987]|uniref:hypothetical protein n=1 Tax=Streptomyces sp. NPDC056987 TaxID=3345988 RepID=UPI0036379BED
MFLVTTLSTSKLGRKAHRPTHGGSGEGVKALAVSIYADPLAGTEGAGGGAYRPHLGFVEMPDGRPPPLIAFEPRGIEGWDDIRAWRGETKMPGKRLGLPVVASHVLLCGQVSLSDPDALLAAAAKNELVAVIARASSW